MRRPRVEHTARGPTFRAGLTTQPCTSTLKQSVRFGLRGRANRYQPNTSLPAWRDHAGSAAHDVAPTQLGAITAKSGSMTAHMGSEVGAVTGTITTTHTHAPREDSQLHHVLAIAARTAMTSFRSNGATAEATG